MNVESFLHRSALGVSPSTTIREAAEIMEASGVGCLVVIDADHPAGIVTDRDMVRRAVARRLDVDARIDAIMSSPVVTIDAADDLEQVFELFRTHPVRRLAVTADGRLIGVVSLDDLLGFAIGQLGDLIRPVTGQLLFAQRDARPPVLA